MRLTFTALLIAMHTALVSADPATHKNIPRMHTPFLESVIIAQELVKQPDPDKGKAAKLLSELLYFQEHIIPAYREQIYPIATDLLDVVIDETPVELWEELTSQSSPPTRLVGFAYIIAVYESLYRDQRWTPNGNLKLVFEDDSIHLEYLPADAETPIVLELWEHLEMQRRKHGLMWDHRDFGYPLLAGIDTEKLVVRQATWDDDTETLYFTIQHIADRPVLTTIVIENIYTNYLAILERNGEFRAAIDEHAQVSGEHTRNLDPGQIEVQVLIEGKTYFTLKPME